MAPFGTSCGKKTGLKKWCEKELKTGARATRVTGCGPLKNRQYKHGKVDQTRPRVPSGTVADLTICLILDLQGNIYKQVEKIDYPSAGFAGRWIVDFWDFSIDMFLEVKNEKKSNIVSVRLYCSWASILI